jgi:hypothetical protein
MFSSDEQALKEFKSFLIQYNKELIQERSGSFDGDIVNALYELLKEGKTDISSQNLLDSMKSEKLVDDRTNVRSIGKHLASLNIVTKNRRVGNKTKHFIDFGDVDSLNQVFLRYVTDYDCSVVSFVSSIWKTGEKTQDNLPTPLKVNDTNDTNETLKNLLSPYTLTQTTHETDTELPQEEYLEGVFSDGEIFDWIKSHDDGRGVYEQDICKSLDVSTQRLSRLTEIGLLFIISPGRYKVL